MDKLKKVLPHLAVFVCLAAISLMYMSPALQGKKVWQSDIIHFKGMAKEIVDFREAHDGEEPLWTNAMFGGMPAYQVSVLYPSNWSKSILKMLNLGMPRPANYLFLLMAGAYFMFIVLGIDWKTSLVGALGVGLCSYTFIILEVGHNSKAHAMAFMAPVLGSVLLAYRGKLLLGASLTAFFLSLQIATNHLQITYYLALILVVMGLVKLVAAAKDGSLPAFIKTSLVLVIAAVVGVAPNASNLWTTAEYGKDTMRGKSELTAKEGTNGLQMDYATNWSYGKAETGTLLIPNFHGGASQSKLSKKSSVYETLIDNNVPKKQAESFIAGMPTYWGTQPGTSGPVYLGAVICFLAVLGMFIAKGPDKWWLLIAFLLSVMLSWGHNLQWFTDLFFEYVPGYNKFRAVSMTLVMAQVLVPIMAVFGLRAFITSGQDPAVRKKLAWTLGALGGFCLLFVLMPTMFFDFVGQSDDRLIAGGYPEWLVDAIVEDRESMMRSDAIRSLAFILLAAALLFLYHVNKLKAAPVVLGIVALVLVDGVSVGKRYLDNDDFVRAKKVDQPYPLTPAHQQILDDPTLSFRVMNTAKSTFQDAETSYYHQSIGGYHGAKLQRFQEVIDTCIFANNMEVLNMLNTRYFIVKDQQGQDRAQLNPSALGNAWFVNEVKMVGSADEEMAAIKSFDPRATAVVDVRFEKELEGFTPRLDSTAEIVLLDNKSNHLKYHTKASSDQLAVFSEIYFANGWNAYLDGELKPHWRANYILRSMIIPAGEHELEFKFEPRSYMVGEKISLAGSIIMLLLLVTGIGFEMKGGKEEQTSES